MLCGFFVLWFFLFLFKSGSVVHLLSGQYVTDAVIFYEHFEKSHLTCHLLGFFLLLLLKQTQ